MQLTFLRHDPVYATIILVINTAVVGECSPLQLYDLSKANSEAQLA